MQGSWQSLNQEIQNCRKCPRLVEWREKVAKEKRRAYRDWDYWGKPVPGFGDLNAKVMVIGLAPGAHGSNRTGRMFTGDSAGDFLYSALFAAGFANQSFSTKREDGLQLNGMFITAVCRCVPPDNKPSPEEIKNCELFLYREIGLFQNLHGFVALGSLAYQRLIMVYSHLYNVSITSKFAHNLQLFPGVGKPFVVASYHPSRQNTQTGRLTPTMFAAVWKSVQRAMDPGGENGS